MSSASSSANEDRLLRGVGNGVWQGMLCMVVVATALVSAVAPDQVSIWGRLGVGVFLAFWSGPFFGMAAAVSSHGINTKREAEEAAAESAKVEAAIPLERREVHPHAA